MSPFPIPNPISLTLSLTLTRTPTCQLGSPPAHATMPRRTTGLSSRGARGCGLARPRRCEMGASGARHHSAAAAASSPPQRALLSGPGLALPACHALAPPRRQAGCAGGGIQGPRRRAARSKRVRGGWPHARLRARALLDHAAVRATNPTLTLTMTPTLTLTLTRPFWTTLRCAPCAERPPCSSAYLTHDDPTRL